MKLERYKDKKETRKKVMLISLTVVTIVSVTMMLYKTFANFRTSTSFTIMSGKVKYKPKGKDLTEVVTPTTSGDGLYKVEHTGATGGWDKVEYRYAGANPNNYVYFNCNDVKNQNNNNCELWRIIGLVNVETSSGIIEQRLKIIRNESIGSYSLNNVGKNDWINSSLKNMLNGIYYNRTNGICYVVNMSPWGTKEVSCNFDSNGLLPESKSMIDDDISWPLGGESSTRFTAEQFYGIERSTKVNSGCGTEWSNINDPIYHNGVGLMYGSDYGYAVGGNARSLCLTKNLFDYNKDSCYTSDWLVKFGWILTPMYNYPADGFILSPSGYIDFTVNNMVEFDYPIYPVIYFNSNVKIADGTGAIGDPFILSK